MYRELDLRIANPRRRKKVAKKSSARRAGGLTAAQIRALLANPKGSQIFKDLASAKKGRTGLGRGSVNLKRAVARATGGEYFSDKYDYTDAEAAAITAAAIKLLQSDAFPKLVSKSTYVPLTAEEKEANRKAREQRRALEMEKPAISAAAAKQLAAALGTTLEELASIGVRVQRARKPRAKKA